MTSLELAAALNDLIAQARASVPVETAPSLEDAFAALLAGTTPAPAPTHPLRCPVTGGVYAFVATAEEARALADRPPA